MIVPSVAGVIENAALITSGETDLENVSVKLPSVGMSFAPFLTFVVTVVGSVFS